MKRLLLSLLLIISFISFSFAEKIDATSDKLEIEKLKKEIKNIKNDVSDLKKKSQYFSFKISGYSKIIWGANIWAKGGTPTTAPYLPQSTPLMNGFDFDNKFRFNFDLGNRIVANSFSQSQDGTKIDIQLRVRSMKLNEIAPSGSWFSWDASDDQGHSVKVYAPRYGLDSSNMLFGNVQVYINKATVKDIAGIGLFVTYKDITEVQQYFGVNGIADILILNNKYFNNGFLLDDVDSSKYATLYYSYDPVDYPAENRTSEAVKLWAKNTLFFESINSSANQKPHGFSIGFEKNLSDAFYLYVEGGGSSKDSFDPEYFEDKSLDYGFFVKSMIQLQLPKKFKFSPKVAFSIAFQSDVTEDSTDLTHIGIASGISLPIFVNLPTGKNDYFKATFNFNINYQVYQSAIATMISFNAESSLLNGLLKLSLPMIYSYKNGNGGFISVGNQNTKWVDQLYDDHLFCFGFIAQVDTNDKINNIFRLKVKNSLYFALLRQWDPTLAVNDHTGQTVPEPEIYFFNVLENRFILHGKKFIESTSFYVNFGVGYAQNARMLHSNITYDYTNEEWVDSTTKNPVGATSWGTRWAGGTVLNISVGLELEIVKNLYFGLDVESPKLLVTSINPVGDQGTFTTIKLWSKIKF